MPNLRSKLIRLAARHPEMRRQLLPILVEAAEGIISSSARQAFETELLPQIEALVQSMAQMEAVQLHMHSLLDEAVKNKDSLYLLLLRYKSLDVSDAEFFSDVGRAVDEWVRMQMTQQMR